MKTIFVSGNDTGIGKTRAVRSLVQKLALENTSVQVIKAVETGVTSEITGDAVWATEHCGQHVAAYRFFAFSAGLAPIQAARLEGCRLSLDTLLQPFFKLPKVDYRIIEGAGGLAVPLDDKGFDWADFAHAVSADGVILVVEDRLGAINQARLLSHYAQAKRLPAYFWLNECRSQNDAVRSSNREEIEKLPFPLIARQRYDAEVEYFMDPFSC